MVGNDTECMLFIFEFNLGYLLNMMYYRHKEVGFVVRSFSLQNCHKPFKTSACINMLFRKIDKFAVFKSIELDKN